MKRLVAILSKSKHRFIVSKGVNHEKYSLADNMWGERSVPQCKSVVSRRPNDNTRRQQFCDGNHEFRETYDSLTTLWGSIR
ncbi:unnamed protein product [Oppiella nova]|uniref:Uncharacterized protein n=1 Tax=Oppiella nova TaxID=334625 RepID=A0A7R9MK30_9ACAR|nr:unnamed protein product [Oppiella nova]CAG2178846.1 unnamed protein product [Oppiella nova]